MEKIIISNTTKNAYYPSKVCRIINPKQQQSYIKYELTLLDIYLSKDYKTGETITVMVFSKEESKPYYEKWLRHELV